MKYAFWAQDAYPYLCGGGISEATPERLEGDPPQRQVFVKGRGAYVTPEFVVENSSGMHYRDNLEALAREYEAAQEELRQHFKRRLENMSAVYDPIRKPWRETPSPLDFCLDLINHRSSAYNFAGTQAVYGVYEKQWSSHGFGNGAAVAAIAWYWAHVGRKGRMTPQTVIGAVLDAGVSKLRTYCSSEWKARVVERHLRSQGIRLKNVVTWLGFSLEEGRRVKVKGDGERDPAFWYPLIDAVPVTRDDCARIILEAGLPLPRKSTCRGCPHQTDAEWWDTKTNYPEDFARAIEDEQQMREKDPHVWMHKSAVSLEQVQFKPKDEAIDAQCGLGICFI